MSFSNDNFDNLEKIGLWTELWKNVNELQSECKQTFFL